MVSILTRTSVTKHALFILAHQDDEYFAAPWILDELSRGNAVACAYLTDGGSRTDPAVRNKESLDGLGALGVPNSNVVFIGGDKEIPDGQLMHHMTKAHAALDEWLNERHFSVTRIYAPDYEGGHPDHDASHIVAAAVARSLNITDSWSFAMYNAYRCPRPLFRVLRLVRRAGSRAIRYPLGAGLKLAMFCWRYRS